MPDHRYPKVNKTIVFEDQGGEVYTGGQKRPRTKRFTGAGHRKEYWMNREFIAWDGEGLRVEEPTAYGEGIWIDDEGKVIKDYKPNPQPYVLLANSKGQEATREEGLSTVECLELLLTSKEQYKKSIFVGFSINYDINQMLKDLHPKLLWALHDNNITAYKDYWIKWYPGKSFYVKHGKTKRSFMLYDVFGFFQKSFLKTCEDYLGKDDPELQIIAEGKAARDTFKWEELDDFIRPYCQTELSMLVRVMNELRKDLHSADIDPGKWHGPGAIASKVFEINEVPISREVPERVQDAAQFAYAGGRFEQFRMGRYPNTVWEYDIRSAYPAAATKLPDISDGYWEYVTSFQPGTFGVWSINYSCNNGGRNNQPQPLFCRAGDGSISYPYETQGWYWTPEAELVPHAVQGGWIFRPNTDTRPFAFIERMFEQRRVFKLQDNSTERALKLCLNSLYGKTAQTIGAASGPPRWHQLEYAGYITSYVRAQIYNAMSINFDAMLATETDAVFSTTPLDLDIGEGLGQWEEKKYDEICYIQSGLYYAVAGEETISKYRGMDRDREGSFPAGLPYGDVCNHLRQTISSVYWRYPPLFSSTTRFVGLGIGLRTRAVWRSWEQSERTIRLDTGPRDGKRYHLAVKCESCKQGLNMYDQPHPMMIGGYSGKSYARAIPWRTLGGTADVEEWEEMDPSMKLFGDDMEKWQ